MSEPSTRPDAEPTSNESTTSSEPLARAGKSRLRRWLIVLAIVLAAVELIYLAGANYFLNSDLASRTINRKPDKLRVTWEGGYTLFPGVARLRGVELRGQNRHVQWYVELDRANVATALLPLAKKRFHARRVRGEGMVFRLRPRLEPGGREADPAWPPIPGLDNPAGAIPDEPPPPPGNPWRVELGDVAVDGVREVWLAAQHYLGDGRLEGEIDFEVRGPLAVDHAEIVLGPGELRVGDEPVAEGLELELEARIERFLPREVERVEVLRLIEAEIRLAAERAGFGFVEHYLRGAPWLDVGGDGRLDAELAIAGGALRPGSRVRVEEATIAVDYLDFEARGTGRVEGVVEPGVEPHGELEVRLDGFEIRRRGAAVPHVDGEGLLVRVTSPELDLIDPEPELEARLELPPSEILDFSFYNAYLPPGAGLAIRSGRGRIEGWMELSTVRGTGSGELRLEGHDLRAVFGEREITGRLELEGRLADADPEARRFTLVDTRLALTDVTLLNEDDEAVSEDWWARFTVDRGTVVLGEPLELDAAIRARVRDSRPLIALAAQKRPILGWIKPLLKIRDLELRSDLRVTGDAIVFDDLVLEGKGLEVLADLRLAENRPRGVLFVHRGPLSAAVAFEDDGRDWKIFRARRWFERRRAGR